MQIVQIVDCELYKLCILQIVHCVNCVSIVQSVYSVYCTKCVLCNISPRSSMLGISMVNQSHSMLQLRLILIIMTSPISKYFRQLQSYSANFVPSPRLKTALHSAIRAREDASQIETGSFAKIKRQNDFKITREIRSHRL